MPGIWASFTSAPSIPWPIDRVLRIAFVIAWRPEITAFLATFPRPPMLILIMGIAHAEALMLHLTSSTATKRHKGGITTYPLLTTRRFHQWRLGIATETTMFARNGLGFHTVVGHRVPLYRAGRLTQPFGGRRGASCTEAFYARVSSSLQPPPPLHGREPWELTRGPVMSQLSKMTQSRDQWKPD